MELQNTTRYVTQDIRRLIWRVARAELDPGDLDNVVIDIAYHRTNTAKCAGLARRGSLKSCKGWMKLLLPRPHRIRPTETAVDAIDLAHTIAHEMAHLRGLTHRDMKGPRYRREEGYRDRYAWAAEFPIRVKQETHRDPAA